MMTVKVSAFLSMLALVGAQTTTNSSTSHCKENGIVIHNIYTVQNPNQNMSCHSGNVANNGGAIKDLRSQFADLQAKLQALEGQVKSHSVSPSSGCAETALISGSNHRVRDSQLSASSVHPDCSLTRSRLNSREIPAAGGPGWAGGWCSNTLTENNWIQVDLGKQINVTSIGTQGRNIHAQWVTSYIVRYSDDGNMWTSYTEGGSIKTFRGNWDQETGHKHKFANPFTARFVRLYPKTWNAHISLRWEIYGCH